MQVALVKRAQGGDQEAFAMIAAASINRCYAIAYRILRDMGAAEDATQQTLLGAWRDLPTLRAGADLLCPGSSRSALARQRPGHHSR